MKRNTENNAKRKWFKISQNVKKDIMNIYLNNFLVRILMCTKLRLLEMLTWSFQVNTYNFYISELTIAFDSACLDVSMI